jgi:V-type H+-transporting ATPase subunit H
MTDDDTTLAVICFDLGEFARFTDYGRNMLISKHVKDHLTKIMQKANTSAELKKEGITCYQKLLMNSWINELKV